MARGIRKSVADRKAELQKELDTVRERIKKDNAKIKDIEAQLKGIEVEEHMELLGEISKVAAEKGTTVQELLKPVLKGK